MPALSIATTPAHEWHQALGKVVAGERSHTLIQGDCRDVLARLPDASVDLVFADPPYNLSNGGTTCKAGRRVSVHKGDWDVSRGAAADHAFHGEWLGACRRVLKPSGTIWVSGTHHVIFSLGYAMQELGFSFLNTVTWFKPNASPNLACRMFTHSTELLIWAAPARGKRLQHTFAYGEMKRRNGNKQVRDYWGLVDDGQGVGWELPAPGPGERREGRHPTQKPLVLLERVITASSAPGALVVDPFNGSGTTAVAALAMGRRYIGADLDGEHLALTERRIAASQAARRAA